MHRIVRYCGFALAVCMIIDTMACNKLVEIPAPINSITASKVFNNDKDAVLR